MKKCLLFLSMLFGLNIIGTAQINSVGEAQSCVIWDLLGREDTVLRTVYATHWEKGDTSLISIYRVLPDTLPYNLIYYFVDNVCVRERVIRLKIHKWPLGTVSTVVDNIEDYTLAQINPTYEPSSEYNKQPNELNETKQDMVKLPIQLPKNSNDK